MYSLEQLQQNNIKELKKIGWQLNVLPESDKRCRQNWIDAIVGINPPLLQLLEVSPAASVEQVQKPIMETVETSPGVEVDLVSELIAEAAETSPRVGVDRVQEPSVQAAKNPPGSCSKFSTAHQLLELFQSRAHIIEDSPGVKTEATVISLAAKNPILTGLTFSDRFLARYAPPQPEIIHFRSDADGQLSLLNFEIESVDEPPDPDDFESLDAFREAIARWDFEHPEELAVSLDSMCEWAPCPTDWYEFDTELEPFQVSELLREFEPSQVSELFTSNFSIFTFSAEDDRPHRSDEPFDTGTFAKLPKPKPPSFPLATVGQAQSKPQPTATQLQAKRIPNAYQTHTCCIVAGSSTQPARSPPGGDAGF
jgi:hypothetical protein